MTEVPQIRVESSLVDQSEEHIVNLHNSHVQDGWLSVPDITSPCSLTLSDSQLNGPHLLDEHSPQPWLGTLYITVMTGKPGGKSIQHELVWVQMYRKYPSVGARLGLSNFEGYSYVMFFPALSGGKRATCTSPNPCAAPLLCLNLRHSTVVPQDGKRFSVITRSGDCCSISAEVADHGDLDYWLTAFRQTDLPQTSPTFLSPRSDRVIRSAPSSPERKRRVPCTSYLDLVSPSSVMDKVEPLNDIVEDEDNEYERD
ncbi:hypothetical protein FBUS_04181 [Fasciolopsis buskii]|uniref:Uncharacterized protein n=1 Tax=Fasciolopsis buskii TaxID=27845 RepID=A0A8E0RL90_9TREM|nr:hypothetical protein FBUS_04181 [Fasciolopsis buski]